MKHRIHPFPAYSSTLLTALVSLKLMLIITTVTVLKLTNEQYVPLYAEVF